MDRETGYTHVQTKNDGKRTSKQAHTCLCSLVCTKQSFVGK